MGDDQVRAEDKPDRVLIATVNLRRAELLQVMDLLREFFKTSADDVTREDVERFLTAQRPSVLESRREIAPPEIKAEEPYVKPTPHWKVKGPWDRKRRKR